MGIGGSVTEGHSWAAMAAEWLQKQYPKTHIHYVDGAFGGTGPDAVVFRFRRDILPHHPDLVFIEYTVNSYAKHDMNFKALDGMVLELLRQWQKPDIVFVYVGNDKGERDLSKVQPLARHYGFQEVDPRQTPADADRRRQGQMEGDRPRRDPPERERPRHLCRAADRTAQAAGGAGGPSDARAARAAALLQR